MEDGQCRSLFHPDKSEWDKKDLEIVCESDTETEARTATLGSHRPAKGESDSSINRFMDNWTSGSDPSDDDGAESEPPAQKAEGKRPRKDADAAGSSKVPKKKAGDTSKRPTSARPSGPVLEAVPLQTKEPSFSMAKFAAHLPRAAGYLLALVLGIFLVSTLADLSCLFLLFVAGPPDLWTLLLPRLPRLLLRPRQRAARTLLLLLRPLAREPLMLPPQRRSERRNRKRPPMPDASGRPLLLRSPKMSLKTLPKIFLSPNLSSSTRLGSRTLLCRSQTWSVRSILHPQLLQLG